MNISKIQRIVGRCVGLLSWLGTVCPVSLSFSEPPFREGIDQETKHHDHAERFDSFLFLEVDFRDMKALISMIAEVALQPF
jgi:hypothetical protein